MCTKQVVENSMFQSNRPVSTSYVLLDIWFRVKKCG